MSYFVELAQGPPSVSFSRERQRPPRVHRCRRWGDHEELRSKPHAVGSLAGGLMSPRICTRQDGEFGKNYGRATATRRQKRERAAGGTRARAWFGTKKNCRVWCSGATSCDVGRASPDGRAGKTCSFCVASRVARRTVLRRGDAGGLGGFDFFSPSFPTLPFSHLVESTSSRVGVS